MMTFLLKKQWKVFFLIVLLYCVVYILGNRSDSFWFTWEPEEEDAYLSGFDLTQREKVFTQLSEDCSKAQSIMDRIRNFEDYEGTIPTPEGEINPALLATGEVPWMTYDMAIWQQQMYHMKGWYTQSLAADERMLLSISARLANQRRFAENIENNKEVMRRGLRRGGANTAKYQAALASFQQISDDFPVTDTKEIDRVLEYLEKDTYILILLTLCSFSLFSSVVQQKISHLILSSKMNVRRYVRAQILAVLCMVLGSLLLYWTGMLLILTSGNLAGLGWQLPIQAVNGYETVSFAVSAGEYMLLHMGLKGLCCIFTVLVILGISLISRNTILAALLSLVYMGILLLIPDPASSGGFLTILRGGGILLWKDLPYLSVGGFLIAYPVLYAVGMACASGLLLAVELRIAKPVFRRRVS